MLHFTLFKDYLEVSYKYHNFKVCLMFQIDKKDINWFKFVDKIKWRSFIERSFQRNKTEKETKPKKKQTRKKKQKKTCQSFKQDCH